MATLVGCGKDGGSTGQSIRGVTINGVVWAECNVDAPGTFAASAESNGKIYQWNSKKAWPDTGDVADWVAIVPDGSDWSPANDPCPTGWHVPTYWELGTLLDTNNVTNMWVNFNGVNGRMFTDKVSGASIFLPATATRDATDGLLYPADNEVGYYWSSSASTTSVWTLMVYNLTEYNTSGSRIIDINGRSLGMPVRCVR